MSGDDRREPLWASSLADRRPVDHDDVIVRVTVVADEEDVAGAPGAEPPPRQRRRPPFAGAIVGAMAAVAVVLALLDGDGWTFGDVPSYWERVPMTCETLRVERDDGAGEWFSCRAIGGGRLPPGLYLTPDSQWRSDITGRPARRSRIRISRDGELEGWAAYRR